MSETLLVTGASGQLGRQVLEFLLKSTKKNIIATTRHPEKLADFAKQGVTIRAADFDDPSSLEKAFHGADRILLISTDAIGTRVQQHKNAIDAAVKVGAKHLVYTSIQDADRSPSMVAPEHLETEKLIQKSGLSYTILRNNLYADNLLGSLPGAIARGALAGAAREGKVAYVTREDCARAAVGALASSDTRSSIVDVTGPEALSYADVARIASEVSGKPLSYVDMPDSEFKKVLMQSGLPEMWADAYVSFDRAARENTLSQVSSAVQNFSGRAATNLKHFLTTQQSVLK